MPRIGAAHRHRDREAGRHQLWSPLRWPASTRLPSCAAAAHRPGPHRRRPSPAPRSFDGGLVSLGPTRPGHPHRPITIAQVLAPRLRSIRLLSRPGPTGWPMLRTACAGPHRTLIHRFGRGVVAHKVRPIRGSPNLDHVAVCASAEPRLKLQDAVSPSAAACAALTCQSLTAPGNRKPSSGWTMRSAPPVNRSPCPPPVHTYSPGSPTGRTRC